MKRQEKILKDDKGEKIKLTRVITVEGKEITYVEDLLEIEQVEFDGGSKKFEHKPDPNNWGGW